MGDGAISVNPPADAFGIIDTAMAPMTAIFYDDPPLAPRGKDSPRSIFLGGPTSKNRRTRWRLEALSILERRNFDGAAVVPEFRDRAFDDASPARFGAGASPVADLRAVSYNILAWETAGIERATVALFWMPFRLAEADDPASLPGFTTRAEVGRELARDPRRVVLGMPAGALSGAHIRYHAHRAGAPIHDSLEDTISAALALAERSAPS